MKSNFWSPDRLLLLLMLSIMVSSGCSKKDDRPTVATAPTSKDQVRDQLDATLMISHMITNATLLQGIIASDKASQGGTTTIGYDFNGMELGKPDDLFCGVNIGPGEDADNYYVKLAYDGPDCSGQFYLKGTVILSIWKGVDWKFATPGATGWFDIYPNGIRITRLADNQSMYITGDLLMYYPNQDVKIASVAELEKRKDSTLYIRQSFENNGQYIVLHYEDSSTTTMSFWWDRIYSYHHGGLLITQAPFNFTPGVSKAVTGVDRFNHYYEWTCTEPMLMYQTCGYKVATGAVTGTYDASEPYDQASIQFGVDKDGHLASQAVRAGDQCLDSWFMHYTTSKNGRQTADILFPE